MFKNFSSYLLIIALLSGLYFPTFFADPISNSIYYPKPLLGGLGFGFFLVGIFTFRNLLGKLKPLILFSLGLLFTTIYTLNLPPFLEAGQRIQLEGWVYDSKEENNSTLLLIKEKELGRKILVILPRKNLLVGKNLAISGKTILPSARFFRLIKSEGLRGVVLADSWQELGKSYFYFIFWLREKTINKIANLLPEPEASLAAGTLVGKEAIFDKNLKMQINKVGLSHIVAVSGYNFIIISNIVVALLKEFFGYLPSLFLSLPFILFYASLAGFSGAVKRAFIFVLLIILGKIQFRNPPALYLLLVCLLFAGILNPFMFLSDFSFLLSALATLGILSLGSWLKEKLQSSLPIPQFFVKTIAETFSASLFVAPITTFLFGQKFFLGLLINLLVVPLVPMIMLFTSLALLISLLLPHFVSLGTFIAFPLPRLLLKIITIANQF
jgi:ComEC/Rec2-related protein